MNTFPWWGGCCNNSARGALVLRAASMTTYISQG